jgi:hypothetical protein
METKVTGSEPVASNRKRGQGSSWTVAPAETEEENKVTLKQVKVKLSLCLIKHYAMKAYRGVDV